MSQNINPYQLLGLSSNSNLQDLRKSYYNLSLLCHPDKGGSNIEMNIVHNAYLYIKEQLDNCKKEESFESLDEGFELFCKEQKDQPPSFRDIYDDCNDFIREFNKEFDRRNYIDGSPENNTTINPFEQGYGHLMDRPNNTTIDYPQNDEKETITQDFGNHLIKYQEPNVLPDTYGDCYQLHTTKINDFSNQTKDLVLSDYVKAFSEIHIDELEIDESKFTKTLQQLIEERENLFNQNIEETPLLTKLELTRNNASIIIQKNIRRFLSRTKLPIIKKIKYMEQMKIPFENYIIELQRRWRDKLLQKEKL